MTQVTVISTTNGNTVQVTGELVGESANAIAVRLESELPTPDRAGAGIAVLIHAEEPITVLTTLDPAPGGVGVLRFNKLPSKH
ncbi:MAG: hypothetical protein WCO88_15555 [Actinomycetota bacterium]|jgi:hypothetical protein